ncbi:GDSL-like Lipase/Acylhydrolase [Astrocystis sublimbata]|nr:GDSL-like Lipase/Acylhydrolase [Astrocystis sublimbata]
MKLLPSLQSALPILFLPVAYARPHPHSNSQPNPAPGPAFILAGDSTTASGGGWGDGFLSFLAENTRGINYGHSGATTRSFVAGGDWGRVENKVKEWLTADPTTNREDNNGIYVTIQFGHNDQKENSGVSLQDYERNLVQMVRDVREWGGIPILITPLTRRSFDPSTNPSVVIDSLHAERLATISAAQTFSNTTYLDLNAASIAYVNALGPTLSQTYALEPKDYTHLNAWGGVVFARIVADLLLGKFPELGVVGVNETMSRLIGEGLLA